MFRCDKCNKVTVAREKQTKVVVRTRTVKYSNGSVGTQIVKEENWCQDCVNYRED